MNGSDRRVTPQLLVARRLRLTGIGRSMGTAHLTHAPATPPGSIASQRRVYALDIPVLSPPPSDAIYYCLALPLRHSHPPHTRQAALTPSGRAVQAHTGTHSRPRRCPAVGPSRRRSVLAPCSQPTHAPTPAVRAFASGCVLQDRMSLYSTFLRRRYLKVTRLALAAFIRLSRF